MARGTSTPTPAACWRCNLDGSELEVYAVGPAQSARTGLRSIRQPVHRRQQTPTAGTGRAGSTSSRRATSGWRIGYQFGTVMGISTGLGTRNIWHPRCIAGRQEVVHRPADRQRAPIWPSRLRLTISGLGLPDRYKEHFFPVTSRRAPGRAGGVLLRQQAQGFVREWSISISSCGASWPPTATFGMELRLLHQRLGRWLEPDRKGRNLQGERSRTGEKPCRFGGQEMMARA